MGRRLAAESTLAESRDKPGELRHRVLRCDMLHWEGCQAPRLRGFLLEGEGKEAVFAQETRPNGFAKVRSGLVKGLARRSSDD